MLNKGILIDSEHQTVEEVEYDGSLEQIYRLLKVDIITSATRFENKDILYVDDEGLLKDPEFFFKIQGYPQPLAGNGLIVGTNYEGDSVSCKSKIEEIRDKVSFASLSKEKTQ